MSDLNLMPNTAKEPKAEARPDRAEQLSISCPCGRRITVYLRHWEKCRCPCGRPYWALEPKKNGPFKLFPWAGEYVHEIGIWSRDEPLEHLRDLQLSYVVLDEESMPIARARQDAHVHNTTKRFGSDIYMENNKGVKVEISWERLTGIPMDRTARPYGDGGKDFTMTIQGKQYTVNVKGAEQPTFLIHQEKEMGHIADLLVLAHLEGDRVTFLGFGTREMMERSTIRDKTFKNYNIKNRCVPASQLFPMWNLFT